MQIEVQRGARQRHERGQKVSAAAAPHQRLEQRALIVQIGRERGQRGVNVARAKEGGARGGHVVALVGAGADGKKWSTKFQEVE